MRNILSMFAAFLIPVVLLAQGARVTAVDPVEVKPGTVVAVTGESLGKSTVDILYLTNGKDDIKVVMTEQTETSLKFTVPASLKEGRWALMLHTTKGQLIEQPFKVIIGE